LIIVKIILAMIGIEPDLSLHLAVLSVRGITVSTAALCSERTLAICGGQLSELYLL
jgi:hypothetical protein